MNTTTHERITIALWFAAAGFIPAVAALVTFSNFSFQSYVLLLGLPVIFAGISGYTIGHRIVQVARVSAENRAKIRWLFVVIISYIILGLTFILGAGVLAVATPSGFPLLLFPIRYWHHFALLLVSGVSAGWTLFIHTAKLKKLLLVGGPFIFLIGVWILWGLPNPNVLPVYPNAENVQPGEFRITDVGTAEEKIISFQTSDTLEKVLDYYEEQLIKDGWYYSYRSGTTLEVKSPSKQYRVQVEQNDDSHDAEIWVRVWHATFP